MRLRPATPDDFGFIRGLAQRPDVAPFLTDEDEAGLAAYLSDGTARLLIWESDQALLGYALFHRPDDPSGVVELRRLALDVPGKGCGAAFVQVLIDYGFRDLAAHRLWLDASGENPRAQRVYQRAGFTLEGRLRGHWYRPVLGRSVDLMIYGMLRDEWAGR